MGLVEQGGIKPCIYAKEYEGLEAVPQALNDVKSHKTWGRVVVTVDQDEESYKARL